MQYKLHLNLRQRAALRTAISFWERKEVKDKATEFFKSCDKFDACKVWSKWYEFTKTVVNEWNKDVLPHKLEAELIHIVKMIGETIFNWYQYIKHEYKAKEKAINCIDEIKWTPYGTVDVVKIFESSWLDNLNVDITKVYNFACEYTLEEHINDLWHKIPKGIQDECNVDSYMRFDRHILAYWKHCRDSDLPNLMTYFQAASSNFNRQNRRVYNLLYNLNHLTEENMLRLSVHQGYYTATKYFWEKLTEEERNESVLKCARIAVTCHYYYNKIYESIRGYKRSQYAEICIFLMNQMSKTHKKAFFNEKLGFNLSYIGSLKKLDVKDEILSMLLSTWPWQELFMPVLKDMIQYQDNNSKMPCMFLDAITDKMYDDHLLEYSLETCKYRCLLREAWLIIPASIKQKIVRGYAEWAFIDKLIGVWDLDSLKLILNDPEIAAVRDELMDSGLESFEQLIVGGEYELLDQFIKEIFVSEDEKKEFKQKINPWHSFVIEGYFHLADKLLDWQSSTPEERQSLKTNIDHISLCESLIDMHDYELLIKFLDWKFETDEERKKCEGYLKTDKSVIVHVYDIWMHFERNIKIAKEKSTEFLNWVFESDEKIVCFKKNKLVNFEMYDVTIILFRLLSNNNMDEFFSWCSFVDEEVQRIKHVVSQANLSLSEESD